ncbi:hypothetical protein FQZ97_1244660 [compost metagenome]
MRAEVDAIENLAGDRLAGAYLLDALGPQNVGRAGKDKTGAKLRQDERQSATDHLVGDADALAEMRRAGNPAAAHAGRNRL